MKLDIDKLSELDADKLKSVPIELSKLTDVKTCSYRIK